jgi:EmrB/QacA subfamily drug resistance transporter
VPAKLAGGDVDRSTFLDIIRAMNTLTAPGGVTTTARRSEWLVLTTLCLGFFMILLDTTIVNIAIPNISGTLDASLKQILWIVNAYTLTYAVLLITGGRLGDMFGPKRLFLAGLVVFTLASAGCGLAHSPEQLIATRIVQGVGGAMLTPQTLAMITMLFPPQRRGAAYGIWGAVAGIATITGPTLGGWLVTNWSWRWIFLVNLPIGIATLVLAAVVMPDLRHNQRHRLDWLGTGLASLGLFLLCFGLIEGPSHLWGQLWGPLSIPLVIAAGLAVLGLFLWQQYAYRNREPLVPFRIFADRNYAVMSVVVAGISFGMLGLFLPLVIFLQSVLGMSAVEAGFVLAPMSLASVAAAPFAGRIADRYGGKDVLIFGLCLWAGGVALVVWAAQLYYNRTQLITGLVLAGIGLGMTFAPLQSIAMHNVQPRMAGSAAGLINTTRQLGAVLGSAAVGALLQAQLAVTLPVSARLNGQALPLSFRERFIDGFSHVAAARNLQIGTGQTGARIPHDLPATVRPAIVQVAEKTFFEAYVPAMHVTLILPLTVLALAAFAVLFVKRTDTGAQPAPATRSTEQTPDATVPDATVPDTTVPE